MTRLFWHRHVLRHHVDTYWFTNRAICVTCGAAWWRVFWIPPT